MDSVDILPVKFLRALRGRGASWSFRCDTLRKCERRGGRGEEGRVKKARKSEGRKGE
jgi:hypothetical protein